MKNYTMLVLLLLSFPLLAHSNFSAQLIKNNTVLSIRITDDPSMPPYEAGALWKIIKGNDQIKMIKEKELNVTCSALVNQTNSAFGNCRILIPFDQFQNIGNVMVFRAVDSMAAKLNRYFVDSAYLSLQANKVFLSSYNTRREFIFGISDDLILR